MAERLQKEPGFDQLITSCEITGPGFINFRLSNAAKTAVVNEILTEGTHFGELPKGSAPVASAMIEFVSANPTGPLHVGHGRGAAVGDCLARLLDANGWAVNSHAKINIPFGTSLTLLAVLPKGSKRSLSDPFAK